LVIGYWLSVIGYWLLVIGYRLSVIGYRLSVIGYWLSVIGYRLLVIGYWLLVIGYQITGNRQTNMTIQTFEDLNCWKACRELRIFISKQVVPSLPKYELYRLGDQMVRSARSTTANIAEGYGRFHYMDNAKFCSNSRGSCWEVLDHLITAHDEDLISDTMLSEGKTLAHKAIKLINGYMKYLQKTAKCKSLNVKEEQLEYGDGCYP
jgi:four helix bundle protein